MPSGTGHLLVGRYRTIKRLGSGGMATVLLAEDERLGRQVAVKRMHAESPAEMAKRFRREAQLGAALNHPNIVSVFDIEADDENVLIVMEHVPGGTLKDALARGPLPRPVALKLLKGIGAALDYAHEHGIVHRDVKPANVLIAADGRAKLADLGIATAAEVTSITTTGTVLGTASYMPPERLDGRPGGAPADVYALATVAYETLTGHKARQGRSAVEVAAMVMSEPPPDLRTHLPDAPEEAALVLARGMARDPRERPASAGELVRELCAAFETETETETETEPEPVVPAPAPAAAPPAPTTHRAARRRIVPVAALAVALVAVAAVLVLALTGAEDDDDGGGAPDARNPTAARSSGSGSTADPGPSSGGDAGTPDPGSSSAADEPARTVEDFYTLAAADRFGAAWRLAGPGLRRQLGGYDGFVGTLRTLKRIEFPELRTQLRSGDRASVQFRSVATHTDHVDRCAGTVDLNGGDGDWTIDEIHPTCNRGPSGGEPSREPPVK